MCVFIIELNIINRDKGEAFVSDKLIRGVEIKIILSSTLSGEFMSRMRKIS